MKRKKKSAIREEGRKERKGEGLQTKTNVQHVHSKYGEKERKAMHG